VHKRALGLAVTVIVGAMLASVSGAATTKAQRVTRIDVSTRAAVIHYLHSIHVKAKGAVIQRGLRNYAGAHCPGARWTCASTKHTVVQIAQRGGHNRFLCRSSSCSVVQLSGVSGGVYMGGRRLVLSGPNKGGGGGNTATCVKTTGLVQSCTINQTGGGQAIVVEGQVGGAKSSGLTQTASYTAQITQTASTGSNVACVLQSTNIDGSTVAKKGTPVAVNLVAHQTITVTQDSLTGNNTTQAAGPTGGCATGPLTQTQTLSSDGTGSGTITQNENASNSGPNLELTIAQNMNSANGVGTGNSTANFQQTNVLSSVATTTDASTTDSGVQQTQSSAAGGIDASVNQFSTNGDLTISANQLEQQCERAGNLGTLPTQGSYGDCSNRQKHTLPSNWSEIQFGPVKKGSNPSVQTTNGNATFGLTQESDQTTDNGATTTNSVEGDCSTTGTCNTTQNTNINGSTSTNTQSGQNVNLSINCVGSVCITGAPPNPSSSSSATFSFTGPTGATFQCQIDNSGYSPCASPWPYNNLADGSHTFSVETVQNPGSPATDTWTISGGGASADTVDTLNPATDPLGQCTDSYSSGGFDLPPQKVTDTTDLSAYDGQAIQLRFSFNTGDALYNAFAGWYLNNIQVTQSNSTVFSDAVAAGDTNFTAISDFGVAPGWHVTNNNATMGTAWWYGNDATGTYQTPGSTDTCADTSPNSGTITTPVFSLGATGSSQLSFDTLWQIEGVNSSGFDLMQVQVIPVTSGPPLQ